MIFYRKWICLKIFNFVVANLAPTASASETRTWFNTQFTYPHKCFINMIFLLIISFSPSEHIPFYLEMIGVGRQGRQIVPGVYSCGHQEHFRCPIILYTNRGLYAFFFRLLNNGKMMDVTIATCF